MFKKIAEFFAEAFGLLGCATGVIGGILLSILGADYWYIAVGIVVLAYAAFPRIKGWWDDLNGTIKTLRKEDA